MTASKDPTVAAVTAAVQGDEQLGTAARTLASTAIAVAQDYLEHGSPQTKLRIISSLLPAIGRAMAAQGEDEEMAELRSQLRVLQQSMLDAG